MKCRICNTEIVLVPSAAERARKLGGKPSDYTKLFTVHDKCALAERARLTGNLIAEHYPKHGTGIKVPVQ